MKYPGQSVFTTATRPKAFGRRAECRRTVNQFFRLVEPSQLAFEDAEVIQRIRVVGIFVQNPQIEGLGVFETARFVVIEGTRKKVGFGHSPPLRPAQVFPRVEDAVAAAQFEMKLRVLDVAGRSHRGDLLALEDPVAALDQHFPGMGIG